MYNELCLSNFVVIKDNKKEIIFVAKGVWILNGLWELHAGHLNGEKTPTSIFHSQVTSCFINVSIFFYFLHCYSCFHWLTWISPCIYMGPTIIIIVGDSCNPSYDRDNGIELISCSLGHFGTFLNNFKKLCLNYCSRRSYYKYMIVFAT